MSPLIEVRSHGLIGKPCEGALLAPVMGAKGEFVDACHFVKARNKMIAKNQYSISYQ